MKFYSCRLGLCPQELHAVCPVVGMACVPQADERPHHCAEIVGRDGAVVYEDNARVIGSRLPPSHQYRKDGFLIVGNEGETFLSGGDQNGLVTLRLILSLVPVMNARYHNVAPLRGDLPGDLRGEVFIEKKRKHQGFASSRISSFGTSNRRRFGRRRFMAS